MYFLLLNIFFRHIHSGTSNAVDTAKLQVKNIVLNQWKLITELKTYISKYTKDKTFENALNKEFVLFLQKIDPKVYGADLMRYFVPETSVDPTNKDNKEQSNSVLPSVLGGLTNKEKETTKIITPKWKTISKSVISKVSSI